MTTNRDSDEVQEKGPEFCSQKKKKREKNKDLLSIYSTWNFTTTLWSGYYKTTTNRKTEAQKGWMTYLRLLSQSRGQQSFSAKRPVCEYFRLMGHRILIQLLDSAIVAQKLQDVNKRTWPWCNKILFRKQLVSRIWPMNHSLWAPELGIDLRQIWPHVCP